MEVAAGTSDAAVIDLLMAGAMIGPDTSYPNLTYTDSLTEEEYGIGCRQGSDLADFITEVLEDAYRDGTTQKLARQFGVREDLLVELPQTSYTQDAAGDVAYIQNKGTLVVGITEFAPMDYKDDSGQWTGFDAELARLVAQRRTNKEIAETLHLSEGTVKQYINQLYAKLDIGGAVRNKRTQLAALFGTKY